MKKIFTILNMLTAMLFVSLYLISCSSSGDSLEETHNTYNVIYAEAAFNSAVTSLNEQFMINRAIAERQGCMKSSFLSLTISQTIAVGMCCMDGILYVLTMAL